MSGEPGSVLLKNEGNMSYRKNFRPPAGVCVQTHIDGTVDFIYDVSMVAPLRDALDGLRDALLEDALAAAKAKRELEVKRQELPKDRIALIDDEIRALETQRVRSV